MASLTADVIRSKAKGVYLGMMCADALSMPVHWYYSTDAIRREFGVVKDFQPAPAQHPTSIMNLANTGGAGTTGACSYCYYPPDSEETVCTLNKKPKGRATEAAASPGDAGRGRQDGTIIGDVINHGKKKFWGVERMHYHQGMKAGENTLNAICARLLVRTITREKDYSPDKWLTEYVKFMTTSGSHNDTYAETYHRMFFANWVRNIPLNECADDDGHDTPSAGGLVTLPPVALLAAVSNGPVTAPKAIKAVQDLAKTQMRTTHNSDTLARYVDVYAELLAKLFGGQDLRTAVREAASKVGFDVAALVASPAASDDTKIIGRGVFSSACYIDQSLPSLLYLAYKYADSPESALIANTNVGGENCHRGAALGAVMGAAHGDSKWPARWVNGLAASHDIQTEASALADLLVERAKASGALADGSVDVKTDGAVLM